MSNFTKWVDNGWAIYKIDVPAGFIFRDTGFGPMQVKIPAELELTTEEQSLKLDSYG